MASETEKYRHLTTPYCQGNGLDIGAGGDPVIPTAIQIDLPIAQYGAYHSGEQPGIPIQWRGLAQSLPFKDGVCDYVYSSHLIEDFADWNPLLREWIRVLKRGGHLVICLPDKKLWNEALKRGQPPNCAHKHESYPGELTQHVRRIGGMLVVKDELTRCFPGDYNILFVAQKI